MSKRSMIFAAIKLLLSKPLYLILVCILSSFLFALYIVINSFLVFASIVRFTIDPNLLFQVFLNQVKLIWQISGPLNVLAVGLVSVLAGINISLTILRTRTTKVFIGRPNLLFFGIFGGAFGASCSACTTSLIALLGVSGGLAAFPLRGLEFSLLALVLLLFSLYFVSKSINEMGLIR